VDSNWMAKLQKQGTNRSVSAPSSRGSQTRRPKRNQYRPKDDARARSKLRTGVAAHEPGVKNRNIPHLGGMH
jgi:hypothetical protein